MIKEFSKGNENCLDLRFAIGNIFKDYNLILK